MATLTRYRPFPPMHALRQEIDRLFGDFLPGLTGDDDGERFSAVWAPRMDLSETDDAFVVKMDLPGIEKDAVTVNVEDHQLVVTGERMAEEKQEGETYLRMERSYGSFYRSIPLPKTANVDAVKAEFKNGVLKVHLPKAEESKPRQVAIK